MNVLDHQSQARLDTRFLRQLLCRLLVEILDVPQFELSVQIVGKAKIAQLNETYLRHAGPTDVLAFDYRDTQHGRAISGEVFVCLPVAVEQARRFRTTWQRELVRYLVHGVLHLCGYDDTGPDLRRAMKKAEDRALKRLGALFSLRQITGHPAPGRSRVRSRTGGNRVASRARVRERP